MKKEKFPQPGWGLALILVSLSLSVSYPFLHQPIVQFVTFYSSADHQVSPGGERTLIFVAYFLIFSLLSLGLVIFKAGWRAKLQVFLQDSLAPSWPSPSVVFATSSFIGLFLYINIELWKGLPALHRFLFLEDGVFESLTSLVLLLSAGLLALSIVHIRKKPEVFQPSTWLVRIYVLQATLFVFFALEEISWGQRIFGWESPELFAANIQHETNLHNFFNPYIPLTYQIGAVLFWCVLLISAVLEFKRRKSLLGSLLWPHHSLISLGGLVLLGAISQNNELVEELVTLAVFYYCVRIFNFVSAQRLSKG